MDVVVRVSVLAFAWWALVEGAGGGWIVAVAVIAAALVASLRMIPAIRWRLPVVGLLRFVSFFAAQSVAGGVDVARRALHPRLDLAPGFVEHPLKLAEGAPRLFFTGVVSLLPGTLSVELVEGCSGAATLRVHVLDTRASPREKLRALEVRVGELFGVAADTR